MKQIDRALPFPLRSNRRINRALRVVYIKCDRTEETRNSCDTIFANVVKILYRLNGVQEVAGSNPAGDF